MDLKAVDRQLMKEFSTKKLRAEMLAERNKKYAYSVLSYKKLDELEKNITFKLAKIKAEGGKDLSLEKTLKQAQKGKQTILKKLGLSEKSLVPNFECKICGDSGFVNGAMCDCYKKRRNTLIIKQCGLDPESLKTFEIFNTDIISNKTQKESLEKLKTKLEDWKNKYPNVKKQNIIICGKPGVGKTFIAECLASEMIKKGYSVCFVTAFEMHKMMLAFHTNFGASKQAELVPLLSSDFLFVDDLGTEPITKNVTHEYLYLVLSERERFKKPTIVTTNLSSEDLLTQYKERIYSRLTNKRTSAVFYIDGNDLRQTK